MTGEKRCVICKLVVILAGIGALNWGLVTFFSLNLVERLLGSMPAVAKGVYGLVGLAGLLLLASLFKCCPCQKSDSGCCPK